MVDIVLVQINSKKENYTVTSNLFSAVPPNIPLLITESYLSSKGLETQILDGEANPISTDDLIKTLDKISPKLIVVVCSGSNPSASTMSMVGALSFFKKLNSTKHEFKSCIMGGHPTVLPERTALETKADFVIIGEGYKAIEDVVDHIKGKRNKKEISGVGYYDDEKFFIQKEDDLIDITKLPMINWGKVETKKYRAHNWHCFGDDINNRSPYAIIWTNQGCPYPCSFCSINNIFGKRRYRLREMKDVVAEIDILVNDHGIKHLKILDELFIFKNPRLDEFCDLLEERNYDLNMWCFSRTDTVTPEILKRLKKIGVNWVAYGFESFDKKILDSTRKKNKANVLDTIKWTKEADINICADVIAGLWDDNLDTIKQTRDFMIEHEFEWLNVYPAFGYPGTPLYDEYISKKIISEPKDWGTYGLYSKKCNPLPTKYLSSSEVLKARDEMFNSYFENNKIQNMIKNRFGEKTLTHIGSMLSKPLERDIIINPSMKEVTPAGGLKENNIEVDKIKFPAKVV